MRTKDAGLQYFQYQSERHSPVNSFINFAVVEILNLPLEFR